MKSSVILKANDHIKNMDSLPITTENVVCFQFMKCCFRSFDSKDSKTMIRNYLSEGISEVICLIHCHFVTSVTHSPVAVKVTAKKEFTLQANFLPIATENAARF